MRLLIAPPVPAGQAAPVGSMIQGSDVIVVHETLAGTPPAYTTTDRHWRRRLHHHSSSIFTRGGPDRCDHQLCADRGLSDRRLHAGAGTGTYSAGAHLPATYQRHALEQHRISPSARRSCLADTIVFYIGIGEDGDGALFRWETNGGVLGDAPTVSTRKLVPDVENMQILYGVETALLSGHPDGGAVRDRRPGRVINLHHRLIFNGVISVQGRVAGRESAGRCSPTGRRLRACTAAACSLPAWSAPLAEAPDGRVRKVYEQTMFLRNMSP